MVVNGCVPDSPYPWPEQLNQGFALNNHLETISHKVLSKSKYLSKQEKLEQWLAREGAFCVRSTLQCISHLNALQHYYMPRGLPLTSHLFMHGSWQSEWVLWTYIDSAREYINPSLVPISWLC